MAEQNPYAETNFLGASHSPRGRLLAEALEIVTKDRSSTYDLPERNLQRIAEYFSTFMHIRFGVNVVMTGADVAQLMVLMKLGRLAFNPDHRDSWVDVAGYAAAGWEAQYGSETP